MSRPLRVVLSSDTAGGVWDFTVTLASGLAAEGHHVLLAIVGDPGAEQLAELPAEVAVESRADPLEWYPASRRDLQRTAEWITGLARKWHADVVHLGQMTYPALARSAAPTLVTVHSDVCSWFGEVRGERIAREWEVYARLVTAGLASASMVATPSAYQRELTAKHFGVRGRVIHNASPPPLRPVDRSSGSAPPLLLSAGRAWDEAKGIRVLDEALFRLGGEAPAAHLFGSTEGPGGARFTPRALVPEGVALRSRVEEWMERATIYAAPSLYEPFGLAPLQAAHRGCALLLSDIGSFRELWDGCARFVVPGDAAALAGAIRGLVEDPMDTARLGELARLRAAERFSPERFIREHVESYRALTGQTLRASAILPT